MNLEQGHALAVRQDRLYDEIRSSKKIGEHDKCMIMKNLWVKTACVLAPSNLTIRHLILQDIINDNPNNINHINKQLNTLAPDIWAEGYSYWKYTRHFIKLYIEVFGEKFDVSNRVVKNIETNFIRTSYLRNDIPHPAPFGDLRDQPLDATTISDSYDWASSTTVVRLEFVSKFDNIYKINPYVLGFNTHTPNKNEAIAIIGGRPQNFKFYQGYENKYSSKRKELFDTFSWKRIISIPRIFI